MRIGIDIDDTICNTYDKIVPFFCEHHNLDFNKIKKEKTPYETLQVKVPNYFAFAKKNYEGLLQNVEIKENVITVLNSLKRDGHELYLITARNNLEFEEPYDFTYNFLKMNNIPFDKLIVNAIDKGKAAIDNKIDLFIDDSIKHCKEVKAKGIKTIMFDAVYNVDNNEFIKVYNWNELKNIIKCGF